MVEAIQEGEGINFMLHGRQGLHALGSGYAIRHTSAEAALPALSSRARRKNGPLKFMAGLLVTVLLASAAHAGPLRDRLAERRAQHALDEDEPATGRAPAGVRIMRDISYGDDPRQRFDVYLPAGPDHAHGVHDAHDVHDAPVIFMVHGGGWRRGDKAKQSVVENKVARWVPRGFILVSTNYRLLPEAAPLEQAQDVARALAAAQQKASSWGGQRSKFILMGHSAGAHLVALLAASPELAMQAGATPWLGTVMLDSAAYDVPQLMRARHARLYDQAFGDDPASWNAVSPYQRLSGAPHPMLAVCSSRRDDSCPQAAAFVAKAQSMGVRADVLEENLSHREINQRLGEPGPYTNAVESFMAGLDPAVAMDLRAH